MTRFEHAVLASVMSTTFAIGGCTADIPAHGEDEPIVENQEAVEQATDDALNRWGMDGLDDAEDQDESRCKYDDDPECKKDDDKHEIDCKDPKHACDPRCDRDKDRKVCIFKSILIEKKKDKNRHLALGAALFKYDAKEKAVDYLLYVLGSEDLASAALFLGDKDKDKKSDPVAILAGASHLDLGGFPGLILSGSIKRDDLTGAFKGEPIETLVDAMKADDIYLGVATGHDKRKPDIRGRVKLIKCKKVRKHDDGKDPHDCKPHHCDDPKHDRCKPDGHDGKHDCKDPKDHDCRKDCKDPKDHDCRKDCKDPKDHDCRKECKDDKHSHCFDKDCKDEHRG